MILAVLASDPQKEEIASSAFFQKHEVVFSENISLWSHHVADAFIDLSFSPSAERIEKLARLLPKPVLVNAVIETLDRIHPDFIRINGWPGFLRRDTLEAAASEENRQIAGALFGGQLLFVRDVPGFVSPRVVAMIINEAYFTWEAGTGTQGDIDVAMKLGTGYPFGPFEWGEKIGLKHIAALLNQLAVNDPVYTPAGSLLC
jgi:3-hydroxybutyryl-CoA dehydrogenase